MIVVSGSLCWMQDDQGKSMWVYSTGIGMGLEAGAAAVPVYSNVDSVDQLLGWAACGAVAAGEGVSIVATGCLWSREDGQGDGYLVGLGAGTRAVPVTGSAQAVRTSKLPSWAGGIAKRVLNAMGGDIGRRPDPSEFCL